jgi:hypothetical protein
LVYPKALGEYPGVTYFGGHLIPMDMLSTKKVE